MYPRADVYRSLNLRTNSDVVVSNKLLKLQRISVHLISRRVRKQVNSVTKFKLWQACSRVREVHHFAE